MLLSFFVLLLAGTAAIAQCDKNVVYYSDKQEMLSPGGDVEENKTDVLSIEFTKETITVSIAENPGVLTASIQETTCQWKDIYKEGKAIYKVIFKKPNSEETTDGTMTVEAKEGKLYILVEMAKFEGKKVKISVNRYEEK